MPVGVVKQWSGKRAIRRGKTVSGTRCPLFQY
jgi:hypothetical protein